MEGLEPLMDESLGYDEKPELGSDEVDTAAVFDGDTDNAIPNDFDPNEDLLSEFQLITEGPAMSMATLSVDELMDTVPVRDVHINSMHISSPLSNLLAPEPLSADMGSPVSPLSDVFYSSRQHLLSPAVVAPPPASNFKPKAEPLKNKLSFPPAMMTASDGTSSSGASTSVTVRLSRSYADPFDDQDDTVQTRARRRVRDFVVGLQNRHFYPYDAIDFSVGLPVYHPLHSHVEVLTGDTDLSSKASSSPITKKKAKPSGIRRGSVSSVPLSMPRSPRGGPDNFDVRHPGSTKPSGSKVSNAQAKEEHQEAKIELDGSCYEGDLLNGVRHGRGVAGYFNGCVYTGDFRKGQEHGYAELRDAMGSLIYRGMFEHGRICGQGTFYYPDGSVYRGEMREGTRHGHGIIWYADGSVYEGDFSHGVRSGNGTFIAADASQYTGEWSNDVRHGKGTLKKCDGTVIDGLFKDNNPDGRCSVTFAAENAEYEGNFKDGLKDGRGTYRFGAYQAVYEGRFARDVIGGTGTLKLSADHIIDVPHPTDPTKSEWMIPVEMNCEVRLAHLRAGFGVDGT